MSSLIKGQRGHTHTHSHTHTHTHTHVNADATQQPSVQINYSRPTWEQRVWHGPWLMLLLTTQLFLSSLSRSLSWLTLHFQTESVRHCFDHCFSSAALKRNTALKSFSPPQIHKGCRHASFRVQNADGLILIESALILVFHLVRHLFVRHIKMPDDVSWFTFIYFQVHLRSACVVFHSSMLPRVHSIHLLCSRKQSKSPCDFLIVSLSPLVFSQWQVL